MKLMFVDVFRATDCTSFDIYMEMNGFGLASGVNNQLILDQRVKSGQERLLRGRSEWLKAS